MRRRGLVWNSNKRLFVIKGEKDEEPETIEEKPEGGKAGSIIAMFDKKTDGKDIAKSLRFGSYQEMAGYMKSKGYIWDNKKGNYKKVPVQIEAKPVKEDKEQAKEPPEQHHPCICMERFGDMLRLLEVIWTSW